MLSGRARAKAKATIAPLRCASLTTRTLPRPRAPGLVIILRAADNPGLPAHSTLPHRHRLTRSSPPEAPPTAHLPQYQWRQNSCVSEPSLMASRSRYTRLRCHRREAHPVFHNVGSRARICDTSRHCASRNPHWEFSKNATSAVRWDEKLSGGALFSNLLKHPTVTRDLLSLYRAAQGCARRGIAAVAHRGRPLRRVQRPAALVFIGHCEPWFRVWREIVRVHNTTRALESP